MDPELVEYLERRFNEVDRRFTEVDRRFTELRQELRAEIATSAAETRRHFDVVAEQLMGKIQLVGEGVIGVDQRVDRLAAEMRTEFQKADRRFLHLQTRLISSRD